MKIILVSLICFVALAAKAQEAIPTYQQFAASLEKAPDTIKTVIKTDTKPARKFDGYISQFKHKYGHLMIGYDVNDGPNMLLSYMQQVLKYAVIKTKKSDGFVSATITEGISYNKPRYIQLSYKYNPNTMAVTQLTISGNADMLINLFVSYWEGSKDIDLNKSGVKAQQRLGNEFVKLQLHGLANPATITVTNPFTVL